MNTARLILSLLFMQSIVKSMDIVPIQSRWHTLAPEMMFKISDELDFCSYENVRRCCIDFYKHIKPKNYYVGFDESMYFHELRKNRNILFKVASSIQEYLKPKKTIEALYNEMDVETYTKKMIFFVRHNHMAGWTLFSFS